jgi:hypothetical protein
MEEEMNKKVMIVLISTLIVAVSSGCLLGGSGGGGNPPSTPSSPPTNGEVSVGLSRGTGAGWYLFSGNSADPLAWSYPYTNQPGRLRAVITSVTNPGPYKYTIAHVDRNGRTTPSYILDPGVTDSVDFNGLEVEGSWTAQFSGKETEAPLGLSLTVKWRSQ